MEQKLQSKLIKKYESEGYFVINLIRTNKTGIPDLLLLKPNEVKFVEVKAMNGKVSPVQKIVHQILKARGFQVDVIHSKKNVN